MERENRLVKALQESGHRLTRQRWTVLEILEESREHLDAEMLYDRAKARDPNISLATVYRTLALLRETGLVVEHRLGEDHAHFEAVEETPHYHFTCQECGKVVEFDAPEVAQVVSKLNEREGLKVTTAHLFLSGFCPECQ